MARWQGNVKAASDEALIEACLAGDQAAWVVLIARYKNLVYSGPVRYRLSPEDAADVFQSVCMELFSEIGKLRRPGALRSWLLTVTSHKCYHHKRKQLARCAAVEIDPDELPGGLPAAQEWQARAEKEQDLRFAIEHLPERCRKLVRMLFYEDPPLPYVEVARRLGLAEGSIGFTRGNCLKLLRAQLKRMEL